MAQYWLRADQDQPAQGPYGAADVRRFAAQHVITADWLISTDNENWYRAARVQGLFAPATEQAPAPPVVPSSAPPPVVPTPRAPTLAYTTPGLMTGPGPIPSKGLIIVFLLVGLLMLASNVVVALGAMDANRVGMNEQAGITMAGGSCAFLLLCAIAATLWLVWIYKAHVAARYRSGGRYPISPGGAVGFSFIPIFAAWWAIYMPSKLAKYLNGRSKTIAFVQTLSVLLALPAPGTVPIFYAITMFLLRRAFVRLDAENEASA